MNVLEKTEMSYTFSFLFFTINTKLTDCMCILWVLTLVLVHMMSLIVCQLAVLIQFLYMLKLNSVTHYRWAVLDSYSYYCHYYDYSLTFSPFYLLQIRINNEVLNIIQNYLIVPTRQSSISLRSCHQNR